MRLDSSNKALPWNSPGLRDIAGQRGAAGSPCRGVPRLRRSALVAEARHFPDLRDTGTEDPWAAETTQSRTTAPTTTATGTAACSTSAATKTATRMGTPPATAQASRQARRPGTTLASRLALPRPAPLQASDIAAIAAARHGLTPGEILRLILAALAVAVVYALFVLVRPTGPCGKCDGRRNYRKGNQLVRCTRCKDGRRYRLGALAVHRLFWSVLGDRLTERRCGAARSNNYEEKR